MADGYPIFLDLEHVPILIVGGGTVAARKARGLAGTRARITVVAKSFSVDFKNLSGLLKIKRAFRASDLKGTRLVFAATDDENLNTTIARRAKQNGCWVNVAAPPDEGNFIVPSSFRRGKLNLAISTGGVSAAASRSLREQLEKSIDRAWSGYLNLLEKRRTRIKQSVADQKTRRKLLQQLGRPRWVSMVRKRGARETGRQMDALITKACS